MVLVCCFFFKQKTAYEMRISDWSSDVCSSDLFHVPKPLTGREKLQQELYITRIAEILLEDVTNTERTQRGIEAGAYDTMQLQDGEVQIRHNLHHVDRWVNARTVREALGI